MSKKDQRKRTPHHSAPPHAQLSTQHSHISAHSRPNTRHDGLDVGGVVGLCSCARSGAFARRPRWHAAATPCALHLGRALSVRTARGSST